MRGKTIEHLKSNDSLVLLAKTFNLFSRNKKRDLSKTYIFTCQHILRPREKMFSLFVGFGIPKENIFILGKEYSTNVNLFAELKNDNFNLYQPSFDTKKTFDEQHNENCNLLFKLFKETVFGESRVIILDDGAVLLSEFNKNFEKIDESIEILGIEQTSSGFRKLENEILKFPIINVARSAIKLNKESPFIADICIEKISDYISENNIINNKFLVVGLGPIGKALVNGLHKQGEKVSGFDDALGHKNLMEKIIELKPNIIIGATGIKAISEEYIEYLNSLNYPIYLVSVSSSDREFPVASYRKGISLNIHSDVIYGNIVFVNNGFPINFESSYYKGGVKRIERTICLLLGSVLYLANRRETSSLSKGFIVVPEKITTLL
ncbi:MAG TPA: hypothetical protein ENI56_02520 [Candidatus Kaiserbacteria bacterium]|nr:hypothetical protein [Candidatus Kaiserbacteria bacterium]